MQGEELSKLQTVGAFMAACSKKHHNKNMTRGRRAKQEGGKSTINSRSSGLGTSGMSRDGKRAESGCD